MQKMTRGSGDSFDSLLVSHKKNKQTGVVFFCISGVFFLMYNIIVKLTGSFCLHLVTSLART